jgi:hypothetical protein
VHTSYLFEDVSRRDRQLILFARATKKFEYVPACYFEKYRVNSITVFFAWKKIVIVRLHFG